MKISVFKTKKIGDDELILERECIPCTVTPAIAEGLSEACRHDDAVVIRIIGDHEGHVSEYSLTKTELDDSLLPLDVLAENIRRIKEQEWGRLVPGP